MSRTSQITKTKLKNSYLNYVIKIQYHLDYNKIKDTTLYSIELTYQFIIMSLIYIYKILILFLF